MGDSLANLFAAPIEFGKKPARKTGKGSKYLNTSFYAEKGCAACPLNASKDCVTPKMNPSGSDSPLVYVLQLNPSIAQDEAANYVAAKSFDVLMEGARAAKLSAKNIRINSIVNCRSSVNEDLTIPTISCRNRIITDILRTKPKLVVGMDHALPKWFFNKPIPFSQAVNRFTPYELEGVVDGKLVKHTFWVTHNYNPVYIAQNRRSHNGRTSPGDADPFYFYTWREIGAHLKLPAPTALLSHKVKPEEGIIVIDKEDKQALSKWIDYFSQQPNTAFDIETSALLPFSGKELIYSAAISDGEKTVAFSIQDPRMSNDWKESAFEEFRRYLMSNSRKTVHNFNMEGNWILYFYGREPFFHSSHTIPAYLRYGDTMAMAYTLRNCREDKSAGVGSLNDQVLLNFNFNLKDHTGLDPTKYLQYPVRKGLTYVGLDAKWTATLSHKLIQEIRSFKELIVSYDRYLRTLIGCAWMQYGGMPVDREFAPALGAEVRQQIKEIEEKIAAIAQVKEYERKSGCKFNPESSTQILEVLRDYCGYDVRVSEDSAEVSSSKNVLNRIIDSREDHTGLAKLILEYRDPAHLLSAFIKPAEEGSLIWPDGKFHPYFYPWLATQRLSSGEPSAQVFPKRKNIHFRNILVAPPGYIFVSVDAGQVEARAVAVLANDKVFIQMLWDKADIHQILADEFIDNIAPHWREIILREFKDAKGQPIDPSDEKTIRKHMRTIIKVVTFATIYGAGAMKFVKVLRVDVDAAKAIQLFEWGLLPGVKDWQKSILNGYDEDGYIYSPITKALFKGVIKYTERVNYIVQNLGVILTLEAMYEVAEAGYWLMAQIHDDLTAAIPLDKLDEYISFVSKAMTVGVQKVYPALASIPLTVEVEAGFKYGEMDYLKKTNRRREYSSTDFME